MISQQGDRGIRSRRGTWGDAVILKLGGRFTVVLFIVLYNLQAFACTIISNVVEKWEDGVRLKK